MPDFLGFFSRVLLIGTQYSGDYNQKTRIIHANRMALYAIIVMLIFVVLFVYLDIIMMALIFLFFVTCIIFGLTLSQQGKFNSARILLTVVCNCTVFIASTILGEKCGSHYVYFAIIPAVFTLFSSQEKELLVMCIFISPFGWVLLEMLNYHAFDFHIKTTSENLDLIRFMCIVSTFTVMILFLYQFLVLAYKNEELLTRSIVSLKTKEKEMSEKNTELEENSKEMFRIQQLLSANQDTLEKEKQKAETALKVKSDFLSSMSHEIRTPMNVIVGLTDLLMESENDTERLDNLRLIKNSSDNLLVIINDILDFSRMESGKLIIETIEFDLFQRVNDVVKSINVKAREKQNIIYLEMDPDLPSRITSDPVRISQVLINLISNANKFTDRGTIKVKVELGEKISPIRSKILFQISDTGIGIAKDAHEKIFESFTQASSSTTRKFGGTGLGLPISKRIVELMDGKIWLESEVDVGSTFAFEIEVKHHEVKQYSQKSALRCLINEDLEMKQLLFLKSLQHLEIEAIFESDFNQFAQRIENEMFNFAIIDFSKEGYELENIEKLMLENFHVKVLALQNNYVPLSEKLPMIYIKDPIDIREIEKVKNAFG